MEKRAKTVIADDWLLTALMMILSVLLVLPSGYL